MVALIGLAIIAVGCYLLYATAHASDAHVNPRQGLRTVAGGMICLGGLILIGLLHQAGILK